MQNYFVCPEQKNVWYLKVEYLTCDFIIKHTNFFLISNVFFFFFCIIAKPKNKSPSKLDKTFPLLCKPKTKCGREGKEKGLLSAESCCCSEKFHILIVKKFFHLLFFAFWTAVDTHFFMSLVHSKVTAILSLCDVALNQLIASEWQVWADVSRKVSAI